MEVDLTESFFLLSGLNAKWWRKSCLTTTSFVRVIFFSFTFYRRFAKLPVCAFFVLFFCVPPVAAEVEEPLSTPRLCIQAIGIKKDYPPSTTTTLLVHAENKYANLILFVEILRKMFLFYHFFCCYTPALTWLNIQPYHAVCHEPLRSPPPPLLPPRVIAKMML